MSRVIIRVETINSPAKRDSKLRLEIGGRTPLVYFILCEFISYCPVSERNQKSTMQNAKHDIGNQLLSPRCPARPGAKAAGGSIRSAASKLVTAMSASKRLVATVVRSTTAENA